MVTNQLMMRFHAHLNAVDRLGRTSLHLVILGPEAAVGEEEMRANNAPNANTTCTLLSGMETYLEKFVKPVFGKKTNGRYPGQPAGETYKDLKGAAYLQFRGQLQQRKLGMFCFELEVSPLLDANIRDASSESPLNLAVRLGEKDLVKILLQVPGLDTST